MNILPRLFESLKEKQSPAVNHLLPSVKSLWQEADALKDRTEAGQIQREIQQACFALALDDFHLADMHLDQAAQRLQFLNTTT